MKEIGKQLGLSLMVMGIMQLNFIIVLKINNTILCIPNIPIEVSAYYAFVLYILSLQSILIPKATRNIMAKSLENETKKLYVAMNEDGSGKISQEELNIILHDKSVPMAANEITSVIQEINAEDSRSIDIMKFLIMVSNRKEKDLIHQAIIRRAATKKAIKKAFRELDQDKDGYISKSEFKRAVQKQKLVKLSEKRLDNVLADADKNNDGKIDYDEFVLMMKT